MQLKGIRISNFMPFAEGVSVDFPDDPNLLMLVNGINGAGKSSLFEAVYWAITGTTVRDIKSESVLRHGTKKCQVSVDLLVRGEELTITRSWSKGSKPVEVTWQGEVKKFHTAKDGTEFILETLGTDPQLLALTAFFGRKFATFSRMKPAERAKVVDLLSRAQHWENARVNAGRKGRDAKSRLREMRSAKDRSRDQLDNAMKVLKDVEALLEGERRRQELADASLSEKHVAAEKVLEAIALHFGQQSEKADDLDKERAECAGDRSELRVKAKAKEVEYNQAVANATDKQALLAAGECPTCGQSTKGHTGLELSADQLRERAEDLRVVVDALTHNLETADRDHEEILSDLKEVEMELDKLDKSREQGERAMKDIEIAQAQASQAPETARLEAQVEELTAEIERRTAAMEADEDRIQDVADHQEAYEFWSEGFKRIRFTLMERTVAGLSRALTAAVQQLGLDADGAEVTLWKDDSRGDKRPEVGLVIKRGEFEDPIEALSEGETQRVDLACFVALGAFIRKAVGFDPGFRVCDEPLNHLDEPGKYAAFHVLEGLHGQRFVMDHDSNFKDLFGNQVTIKKDADTDTARVE